VRPKTMRAPDTLDRANADARRRRHQIRGQAARGLVPWRLPHSAYASAHSQRVNDCPSKTSIAWPSVRFALVSWARLRHQARLFL
jgi:hypothetical protein